VVQENHILWDPGVLYTAGRGQLKTAQSFSMPEPSRATVVEFDWKALGGNGELFQAVLRTASQPGPCCDGIEDGLFFTYYGGDVSIGAGGPLSDDGDQLTGGIAEDTWYRVILSYTTDTFTTILRDRDTGALVWQASLRYTGTALGEGVNLYSREFCTTASLIDNFRITTGQSPCDCDPCDPACPDYDPCTCSGGAACDTDGDGFENSVDGCPTVAGPCDGCPTDACGNCPWFSFDSDGDGFLDCLDNCPSSYNPDQSDLDGDGAGDVCDSCPTGSDPCNPSCWDFDPCACAGPCTPGCPGYDPCACGEPGACDSDGDGTIDANDQCPNEAGPCDGCPLNSCGACGGASDVDGDAIPDCIDNCLWQYNPDQIDVDGDGQGDACDACPTGSDPCNIDCADFNPCACDPWSCDPCNPASPNYDPCQCPADCNCPANCPPIDSDGDGIVDDQDNCPLVFGDPACGGCPSSYCNPCDAANPNYDPCQCPGDCACPGACDYDDDGIPDSLDGCPYEFGDPTCNGCPWWYCNPCQGDPCCGDPCCQVPGDCLCNPGGPLCDSDGDGVLNATDGCPKTPGTFACNGCPDWCGACTFVDCNGNGLADSCELTQGTDGRELLFDGGFEQAEFRGCPNSCATSCNFPLPGWERGGWITEDLVLNIDTCWPSNPGGGQYYMALQGSVCCDCDNNGSVTQYLAGLTPGATYRFELDVFLDEFDALQVQIGGQTFAITPATVPVNAWTRATWEFVADGSESFVRVASIGTPDAPGCREAEFAHVDNLSLRQRVTATDCDGNGVPDECDLANGAPDCNANGVLDSCDLANGAVDCNGNLIPDSCDIAAKQLEDCNGNGIGDECEKVLEVRAASPRLAPIGFGAPATWLVPDATLAVSKVQVLVRAKGDFSSTMEWLDIAFGDSGAAGTVFRVFRGYVDCQVIEDGFTVELTPEAFNNAIRADGTLQVRAVASIAVDAGYCFDDTWVEFEMLYLGAAAPDCNANGLLDSCELAAGYATDANGNGVIDTCEAPVTQCPGDYDLDQAITGQDLSLLLAAWGTPNAQVDLTGDGQVDGNDMAVLLAGWGSCAQ
jgi:hypothetical protein